MRSPDFLLVHGAWHDGSCWARLAPLLEARGFRVHTPDLPGHGEHPLEAKAATLKAYSGYISHLIDNIENNIVLVGHSMSGMVISQVAEDNPRPIARLVYLSAYLPRNGQSLFDIIGENRVRFGLSDIEVAMTLSADKLACTVERERIAGLFYNRCDPDLADSLADRFVPQATLPLSAQVTLSPPAYGRVPKTYLSCLDDRVIPLALQQQMMKYQPCDTMIQLDADHSPFYSAPKQLAAVLDSIADSL